MLILKIFTEKFGEKKELVFKDNFYKKRNWRLENCEDIINMLSASGLANSQKNYDGDTQIKITDFGERVIDSFGVEKHSFFGLFYYRYNLKELIFGI